jgi:hypothetical protein
MRVPSSWASTFSMTSVSVAVPMSVGGASCQVIQRGVLGPPVSRAELELVGALTVLLSGFPPRTDRATVGRTVRSQSRVRVRSTSPGSRSRSTIVRSSAAPAMQSPPATPSRAIRSRLYRKRLLACRVMLNRPRQGLLSR